MLKGDRSGWCWIKMNGYSSALLDLGVIIIISDTRDLPPSPHFLSSFASPPSSPLKIPPPSRFNSMPFFHIHTDPTCTLLSDITSWSFYSLFFILILIIANPLLIFTQRVHMGIYILRLYCIHYFLISIYRHLSISSYFFGSSTRSYRK